METKRFFVIQLQILCFFAFLIPLSADSPAKNQRKATVTYERVEKDGSPSFVQLFSWEPDEYALSYELEIQDENHSVRTFASEQSSVKVSLTPGIFQYRIRVYDLLGRPASVTDWQQFEILSAVQPIITSIEDVPIILPDAYETEFIMHAQGITEQSVVCLISQQDGERIPCSILDIDGTQIRAAFKNSDTAAGTYMVHVQNPAGLSASGTEISLTAAAVPHIRSVELDTAVLQPGETVRAAVTGTGLSAASKAELVSKDGLVRIPAELRFTETPDEDSSEAIISAELIIQPNSDRFIPGEWTVSVTNPGGFSSQSNEVIIEQTFQPEITSVFPAQQTLLAEEPVAVTVSGYGFFERSVFTLVCTDNPAESDPKGELILTPITQTVHKDSAYLVFPAVPQPYENGTYTVVTENPRDLTCRSQPVPIRFAYQPFIIAQPERQYFAVENKLLQIPITVQNVQQSAFIELISEDNSFRIPGSVQKRIQKKDGTELITLLFEADSISEQTCRIQISNDRNLRVSSDRFTVIKTAYPDVIRAETQTKVVKQGTSFTVDFTATGFIPKTALYLVPANVNLSKDKLPRSAIPASSIIFDGTSGSATFNSMQLKDTKYVLAAENPGKLRDANGSMKFTLITRIDISAGIDFGSALRLYSGGLSAYGVPFNINTIQAFLSYIQPKKSYGYFGAEFAAQYQYWLYERNSYDIQNHSGTMHFNILYQYPFFNERLRVGVKAGIGILFLNRTVTDTHNAAVDGITSDVTTFASFCSGLSVVYFPVHHVFFTVSADFIHSFASDTYMGFITPRLGVGIRF